MSVAITHAVFFLSPENKVFLHALQSLLDVLSCRCLHLSSEECQGLYLGLRLIMSVVSLLRPVINLSGERAADLHAGKR